ncbi:MAG: MBL fold metallo-hydrolase [Nevskia sp.]|nr:MBL fold metallo-hydrolase [Nevskia sp.]
MLCEIEFLAVGEASKAGDAIIVRYGDTTNYELMLIDGGTADTGETLVQHLKSHFGDKVQLTHVVLTHSDNDHASGLREVLREIPVANLWLHIPWLLAKEVVYLFKDSKWTPDGLANAIRKEYGIIEEIIELAEKQGTSIYYPFQGEKIGPFTVLSPRRATYLHLLPQFEKTPEPNQEKLEAANIWIGPQSGGGLKGLFEKAVAKVQSWITETWANERLRDGGVTSASNESSVILYADLAADRKVLLTGDAGNNALTWAANYAKANNLVLQKFSFAQIPHHGSRRNVGPTVLNELIGPILPEGSAPTFTAFVSVPADDDQHPKKIVLNAFMRRGGRVIATQGTNKVHYGGFPARQGYVTVTPMEFSTKVEEYD